MAKVCTEATNIFKFFMACSGLDLTLGAGAAGFEFSAGMDSMKTDSGGAAGNGFVAGVGCGAGEGRIYTWSTEGATGSGYLVS